MGRKRKGNRILLQLLFLTYVALMLWLLFGQRFDGGMTARENWNLIPLKTLKLYAQIILRSANADLVRHAFINLAGNVVMFLPLGFFLPAIWKNQRNFFLCLFTVALIIIVIEAVQYATMLGSCDIDDLLLNLPGSILGYGFQRLLWRSRQ